MKLAVAIGVIVACAALWSCGGTPHVTIPLEHRASTPAACTPQTIEGSACVSGGTVACSSSSDCTAGLDGSCNLVGGVCSCVYDACLTDSDCAAGSACACDAERGGAGSSGNPTKCVPANCRLDADCGPGGYCSESEISGGPGGCGRFVSGFFCHTKDDECGNASDCGASPDNTCLYSPELGHWMCGTGAAPCAG